ncbi:hypothetical protein TVAG_412410 [Trichomonas vaginalis G3]|uniref:Uncharacterized protein n=1 Tax=Trichomonas vaginalis (strain ATCC PRA-98 / G3) TaxID=412133 RepID=A2EV54_TRIV3|nr:armadillo-like helical domain containing protein 1 family [Trichomonas vaginalis G3]EAY03437.1 hypothetical protein TVAG_412410 [Trichomonas vaginalis G3]KAI5486166.1 armadillo-like helical domain containing protein 1 family [Trichomonas vaginalis G3]|eukprot:XP_001315660.1 hypothetical protein [Trichomonas vaginalis G3]
MSKTPRSNILRGAGMASSYYSISIIKGQLASQFKSPQDPKKQNYAQLSPRVRVQVQKDQKIYESWLNEWDRNANFNRFLMLQKFIRKASGFSVASLDRMFGNSTDLVFCHIFSFFKVNCLSYCSIALQLRALRVFFEAVSGQKFCEQFVSGGGHTLIADLLPSKLLEPEDQIQIMTTLSSICVSAEIRQIMVDEKIINKVIEALPITNNDQFHNLAVTFISCTGDSAPNLCESIQNTILPYFVAYSSNERAIMTLARSYRISMLPELSEMFDIKNHLYEIIVLTRSSNHEIQSDGILIFSNLMDNASSQRRDFLLQALSDLLSYSKDGVNEEDGDSLELQQSFVLRLFVDILTKKQSAAPSLCQLMTTLLPNLVRLLGNKGNFATQMHSAQCLVKLMEYNPEAKVYLTNAIPDSWVNDMIQNYREFCLNMTQTQCDTLSSLERSQFLIRQTSVNFAAMFPKSKVKTPHSARTKTSIINRDSPLTFQPKIFNVSDIL